MALTTPTGFIIKVCGITTEEDGRAAVAAGATAVGFNFYDKSPRSVTPEHAQKIAASLPDHVLRVGVFVNEPAKRIFHAVSTAGLNVVQLHGTLYADEVAPKVRVWRALAVDETFTPAVLSRYDVEAFLLDTPSETFGGSGKRFDWSRLDGIRERIVLAGGLDGTNVTEAISQVRPWGVDACSRLESQRGRKSQTKVREFVQAAVAAYAKLKRSPEPMLVP